MTGPLPIADHPDRARLSAEVHARPYMHLAPPERATHLALLTGEDTGVAERALVAELCRGHGAPEPDTDSVFHVADLGGWRLRWERHTEFSTYGFFAREPAPPAEAGGRFSAPVIDRVPRDWLVRLPGQLLAAIQLEIEPAARTAQPIGGDEIRDLMGTETFAGAAATGGGADVWMNFMIGEDGYGRILIRDRGLRPRQAGRLTQRLFEIETYRVLALLALPPARRYGSDLRRLGDRLSEIAETMVDRGNIDDEQGLLDRLTRVATETERIAVAATYRFGAARAYHALVQRRIAELREERIEGQQTIGEFMERRLSPAMRTVEAVGDRLETLSRRISRTSQLLRTRVDVQLEAQNRDLLASMDRRARMQLILQETVEGLSIAAITYYSVGLVSYAARAVEEATGSDVPVEIVTGLSIPLIAGTVWWGLRRVRRALRRRDERRER